MWCAHGSDRQGVLQITVCKTFRYENVPKKPRLFRQGSLNFKCKMVVWEVRTGCRTSGEVGAALRRGGGDRAGRRLSHDTAHVSESLLGNPQGPVRSHTNYTRCYSTVQ